MYRFLVGIALVLGCVPIAAFAQVPESESVASFNVDATVTAERLLTVTETITYDFGETPRRGIFREIPVKYSRNGGNFNLRLKVISVTMDGAEVPWKIDDLSPLILRIGEKNSTITGRHTYAITYRTDRALNFFDGEGELYWNVTGNKWKVPIASASIRVHGPEGFEAASAPVVCFIGVYGSTEEGCTISANDNTVIATTNRLLREQEGMTIAIRFPKGVITEPTLMDRVMQFLADNGILGVPILVFILMFWHWYTRGREPKGKGTIVPHYAPPRRLSPAEMITLRTQSVPLHAVTATIIDLARRGYLRIVFGEEKKLLGKTQTYTFVKTREADAHVSRAEKAIFDGLFKSGDEVTIDDLKGAFYKNIGTFQSAVITRLQEQKMFVANPSRIRGLYMGGALLVAVLLFWFFFWAMSPLAIVAIVLSALIIAIFGYFMPQKTKEGAVVLEEVEGFKWFLSVTEKERLAFHNAPAMKPEQFHQFLPAAIAFGVEEKWAEQFKGITIPAPDYATGLDHWNTIAFVSAINHLNHAAAASAYAPPSSGGAGGSGFSGGGSGGGVGGGGGGSW